MSALIDSLPIELLVAIFSCVIHDDSDHATRYAHRRTTLALVSKAWHRVVSGTPSLWTRIEFRDSGPVTTVTLCLSQGHHLDVNFPLLYDAVSFALNDRLKPLLVLADKSFKEVCQHVHRWRKASLTFPRGSLHPKLLAPPAPRIEEAWIEMEEQEWFRQDSFAAVFVDLFSGEANRLRRLHLTGLTIPWNTPILSGLQDLVLQGVNLLPPTIDEMMAMLIASPELASLTLKDVDMLDVERAEPPPELPRAHLPLLTKLSLTGLPGNAINHLLQHIHSPPCEKLIIHGGVHKPTPINRFIPEILSDRGCAYVGIGDHHVAHIVAYPGHDHLELRVTLTGDPTLPLLRHLLSSIPTTHFGLETQLRLTMEDGPLPNFAAHLTALENISHINIDAFPEDTNTLLQNSLPKTLRHLTIFLNGATPGALGNAVKAHPIPLKTIITSGARSRHEGDRITVESTVGVERVFWNVAEEMHEYPHELEEW